MRSLRHKRTRQNKSKLTVKCVLIGASDTLYSPVTNTFLCTSSRRHFFDCAVSVKEIECILEINETKKVTKRNSATFAMFVSYLPTDSGFDQGNVATDQSSRNI